MAHQFDLNTNHMHTKAYGLKTNNVMRLLLLTLRVQRLRSYHSPISKRVP